MSQIRLRGADITPDDDGVLPSTFRILRAGENPTAKGTLLFDDAAAQSVMAAYEQHGVDVMIDLEHLSLDQESRNFDPDARGWAKLAVRDGELWAVDVRWGPDGALRLTERRQRYVSPVVAVDDDGRVMSLLNIAITALPATDNAQPLMAASKRLARKRTCTMDETEQTEEMRARKLARLRELMALPDEASPEDVVAALEEMPAADVLEIVIEAIADVVDEVPSDDAEIAMAARKLAGRTRAGEVIARLSALTERQQPDASQAQRIEELERRVRERDLDDVIALNARKLDPQREKRVRELAQRYDIDAARAFVDALPEVVVAQPPTDNAPELSEHAVRLCADKKIDPAKFAALRASMRRGAV